MASAKGVLMFASAANNTANEPMPIRFPANHKQVLAIFSADNDGLFSRFNPPPRASRPNFMFPGQNILAAWPSALQVGKDNIELQDERVYRRMSGTSCSTPIAAATAAGILEFVRQPREATIDRPDWFKRCDKIEEIFSSMAGRFLPGQAMYHYVKPWKFITTTNSKEKIVFLLNNCLQLDAT
jgi:Subtilase family